MVVKKTSVKKEDYNNAMDEFIKAVGLRATAEHFDTLVRTCIYDLMQEEGVDIIRRVQNDLVKQLLSQVASAEDMATKSLDKLADRALQEIVKNGMWGEHFKSIADRIVMRISEDLTIKVLAILDEDITVLRKAVRDKVLQSVGQFSGRELEQSLSEVLKKELLAGIDSVHRLEQRLGGVVSRGERRLQALESKAGIPSNYQDSLNNYEYYNNQR